MTNTVTTGQGASKLPLTFAGERRKVMSYNVDGCFRKPHEVRQAVAAVILRHNPDVIALQEAGSDEAIRAFNENELGGQYPNLASVSFSRPTGLPHLAFLSKAPTKPLNIIGHLPDRVRQLLSLENMEDRLRQSLKGILAPRPKQEASVSPNQREVLEATFKTESGFRFTLFDTHFRSMRRGGEAKTTPTRLQEARFAAGRCKQLLQQDPEKQFLIVGDLNSLQHTPFGQQVLAALSMEDDPSIQEKLVEVLQRAGHASPTNRGKRQPEKLDYMFASPAMTQLIEDAYVAGSFEEAPYSQASSHLPVIAEFEEPALPQKEHRKEAALEPLHA